MARITKQVTIEVNLDAWNGGDIVIFTCGNDNMPIALPMSRYRTLKENGQPFWCPSGHNVSWADSENARLKQQLNVAQEQVNRLGSQVKATDLMLTAETKRTQRLERRVNNGVCPHCHRTFKQLQRHLASKHSETGLGDSASGQEGDKCLSLKASASR